VIAYRATLDVSRELALLVVKPLAIEAEAEKRATRARAAVEPGAGRG
jgi:hypothetical protein